MISTFDLFHSRCAVRLTFSRLVKIPNLPHCYDQVTTTEDMLLINLDTVQWDRYLRSFDAKVGQDSIN